jgi:hypothetical protein
MADQRLYLEFRDNCDHPVMLRRFLRLDQCTGCGTVFETQTLPQPWARLDPVEYCSQCRAKKEGS